MKKMMIVAAAIMLCLGAQAQKRAKNQVIVGESVQTVQSALKFQEGKPFRILQMTDLHYIHGDERSQDAVDHVNYLIDTEKPDLIIVTGDLIYGRKPNGREGMKAILDVIASHNLPFAVTFGNHDDEQSVSREELLEIIKTYPNSLTSTTEGITGVTNYILEIGDSSTGAPSQLIYVFDSNSYISVPEAGKYDYIHHDQIQWYMTSSRAYAQANGGAPLPAMAFMHIPLPEYNEALRSGAFFIGTKRETGGESKLNSGLFAAAKELGDIRAFVAGHDHNDDYVVNYYGVALIYGRYSGCNTVYNDIKPAGGRVFELYEGKTEFRTYVRLIDGRISDDIIFPNYFVKKK